MRKKFDYRAILGEGNPLPRYPRLLEAAIDEFSVKKYEDASLNDILKHSGMSKGSLYHHFGDKFGLYLAMMDIIIKKKVSYFYPSMRQKADGNSDFFDSLKEIMKGTMDFMLADERLHHLFNRVLEESDEFRNRLYAFFPIDSSRYFHEYIRQAMQSGQIDNRYSPEFVTGVIEILFSNLHKLISAKEPDEFLNTANQVVDMIRDGISANRPPDSE
ncbi:TetR/AcrR family transcriptional regulator [Staphylospora marina]|uniref:TetR/AcrR family transcriptional regulator n=1 Tax=Staphylospora marina TaxID=2490858 RepID=UPI0013DDDF6B|nr:TetR/AcrR family transcriptional regulator [Staphylospora marina]